MKEPGSDLDKSPNPEKKPKWSDLHQSTEELLKTVDTFYQAIIVKNSDQMNINETKEDLFNAIDKFNSLAVLMYDALNVRLPVEGISPAFQNEEEYVRIHIGFALKYQQDAILGISNFEIAKKSLKQEAIAVDKWNRSLKLLVVLTSKLAKEELSSN